MNEQVQARRRADRSREGLATFAMALGLALALALLAEALAWLLGTATGRVGWQRGWADALLLGHPLSSPPLWRDLLALTAALSLLCLLPARRMAPTLVARYDTAALRVEPPTATAVGWRGPTGAAQQAVWDGLERWCREAAVPDRAQRLGMAVLIGGSEDAQSGLAEAFSRHIDGTVRLQSLSRFQGLAWRLHIKLDECRWWRPLPPGMPWDAGYLPLSAVELQALAAFRPRRATLLVADQLHPALLVQALETLEGNCAGFSHPVRLLVLADRPERVPALRHGVRTVVDRRGARRVPAEVLVFDLQAA